MPIFVSNFTEKWCPLARVGKESSNRDADGQPLEGTMCIGESCIAWNWDEEATQTGWCNAFGPQSQIIQREEEK